MRLRPSDGYISTLRTNHPSYIGISPDQLEKREDAIADPQIDSTCTLPVDSTMDSLDWFPDFNDVSSSWMPIDGNNYGSAARVVVDPGIVGGLFHNSFNMWGVMDKSVQIPDCNAPAEEYTM